MFYGLSHVDVSVTNLERALALYRAAFGFSEQRRGEGFVDLEAGAASLRLVRTESTPQPSRIRLQVRDVRGALDMATRGGAAVLYEPMRTQELEEVAVARDPDGNTLLFWRPLSEDEYGFTPLLPKDLEWDAEAEALMQRLLSHVPAMFRGLARRRVTKVAEELAMENRTCTVRREQVVRGYILASARVTRDRTRVPLLLNGIDPERYRADYES